MLLAKPVKVLVVNQNQLLCFSDKMPSINVKTPSLEIAKEFFYGIRFYKLLHTLVSVRLVLAKRSDIQIFLAELRRLFERRKNGYGFSP